MLHEGRLCGPYALECWADTGDVLRGRVERLYELSEQHGLACQDRRSLLGELRIAKPGIRTITLQLTETLAADVPPLPLTGLG